MTKKSPLKINHQEWGGKQGETKRSKMTWSRIGKRKWSSFIRTHLREENGNAHFEEHISAKKMETCTLNDLRVNIDPHLVFIFDDSDDSIVEASWCWVSFKAVGAMDSSRKQQGPFPFRIAPKCERHWLAHLYNHAETRATLTCTTFIITGGSFWLCLPQSWQWWAFLLLSLEHARVEREPLSITAEK